MPRQPWLRPAHHCSLVRLGLGEGGGGGGAGVAAHLSVLVFAGPQGAGGSPGERRLTVSD